MRTKLSGILTLVLAFVTQLTFAQQQTVTGTVTDESGLPLPGATVIVKETNDGITTDFDGNYSIQASQGQTLTFSYVGYTTQTITVGSSNTINLSLLPDNELDEVVVTGVAQGTSTKKLGFKVEKVGVAGVQTVPTPDAASALTGKVAGAQIVRGSGNPLRNSAIVLRGASSIIGDSEPLVIIDGAITEGGLRDVNMEDVEAIEVVKGAAASALYGSLAGNGVIQIITKRGKTSKPKVTFKTEYGVSSVTNKYPLATKHDALLDASGNFDTSSGGIVLDPDGLFNNPFPGTVRDNIDQFVKPQAYNQLSASVSQRFEKIDYLFSAQSSEVDGVIRGIDPYKRQSYRLNLNINPTDKLKIGFNTNLIKTAGQEVAQAGQGDNIFYNFLTADPTVDLSERDANGNFIPFYDGGGYLNEFQNPFYIAENQGQDTDEFRILASANAAYAFNDKLSMSGNVSIDKNDFEYVNFFPRGYVSGSVPNATTDDGFIRVFQNTTQRTNSSVQLNYQNNFGENFNLRTSLKYLFEDVKFTQEDASGSNFPAVGVQDLGAATQQININSFNSRVKSDNVFLTADFDWKDKLIVGGVVRYDRSSLFGSENRGQVFWRSSLAYRLGEDLNVDWIDELKIRGSYGIAGIRPRFGDIEEVVFASDTGTTFAQQANAELQSPEISELEVGIDFAFLGKYKLGLTYAKSDTEGALLDVPLAGGTPFQSQIRNVAQTEYTSYEVSFSGTPIQTENFSWNFGITGSSVENLYGKLGVQPFNRTIAGNLTDAAPALNLFRVEEGLAYGTMFGNSLAGSLNDLTVVGGVVINEGLNLPLSDFSVNQYGHVIVTANDGQAGGVAAGGEQAIRRWDESTGQALVTSIGDTNPDIIAGFTNTFTYKNFSLYTLLDMQFGGDVYNYTKQLLYFNNRHADAENFAAAGQRSDYFNSVSTIYNGGAANDYFVEDASFVKIREISLSYLLGKENFGDKLPIENIKFTLSGRNLFTFTDYTGWDPEVAVGGSPIFKLDDFAYPNFKTLAGSVQITF